MPLAVDAARLWDVDPEVVGLLFSQHHLSCLSLFSYLIGDEASGRAVVVDPPRDVDALLDEAESHGLTIERVIETHFHADFLSGHLELAAKTGAVVSYGSAAEPDFAIEPLAHGQTLSLGDVTLEIRHTPGHTPESISVVVYEHASDDHPWGVLTGDTLFIGDVGRPDLLASAGWTADDLAKSLYRSLHEQLMTLSDATRLWPAHGAGSSCGKSMSDAASSTIGEQRRTNYALQPMTEAQFVAAVTENQSVAPLYFAFTVEENKHAHELLDETPPAALTVDDLDASVVVLDGRSPESFASGHLRGAVNVGMDGRFSEYAGDVIRARQPIVLVSDAGREREAKMRLGRIGFDQVVGAIPDIERVLIERPDRAETSARISASELASWIAEGTDVQIVDVRSPSEQADGMVPDAIRLPLPQLLDRSADLDREALTIVYCAGGYRSSIGSSLLKSLGFAQVADLQGGYAAWELFSNPPTTP